MIERKLNPVKQAYQEMPKSWYEKLGTKGGYLVTLGSYLLTILAYKESLDFNNFEAHAIAASLYTIGFLTDTISTGRALDVGIKIKEVGIISYAILERNPLLSKVKSSSELYRSPRGWVTECALFITGTALPPIGIAIGVGRTYGSMINFRLAKRGQRIAELALKMPSKIEAES